MKKEELRIGNWYLSVKFGVPVRCELSDLYELCVRSDGAYNDPPIGEMFEAIPLTREWLEKFGFWRNNNRSRSWYLPESVLIKMGWTTHRFYINFTTGDDFLVRMGYKKSLGLCFVKYVHQLQTIYFALTGEELKTE